MPDYNQIQKLVQQDNHLIDLKHFHPALYRDLQNPSLTYEQKWEQIQRRIKHMQSHSRDESQLKLLILQAATFEYHHRVETIRNMQLKMDKVNNVVSNQMEQVYQMRVECLREEMHIQKKLFILKNQLKQISRFMHDKRGNNESSDSSSPDGSSSKNQSDDSNSSCSEPNQVSQPESQHREFVIRNASSIQESQSRFTPSLNLKQSQSRL